MEHGKRVVVIGSDGPVPKAIQAELRGAGWMITAVRRGDDPLESVADATAVVVLEGIAGDPALYKTALLAVAEAMKHTQTVKHVVALTPHRMAKRQRKSTMERFVAAEDEARGAGLPLVAVRFGLIVGTQQHSAPADGALFGGRFPIMPIPGRGQQRVRPLLVDDLARLVVAALEVGSPGDVIEAEGPEEESLKPLVSALAGPHRAVLPFRSWAAQVVAAVAIVVPGVLLGTQSAEDPNWWSFPVAAVVYVVGFLIAARLFTAQRRLPDADLLLLDSAQREIAGVELRPVRAEWGQLPAKERALRRERRKSVQRYRLQAASPLIAAFLVLLGVSFVVIGMHDVLFGESLGTRLAAMAMAIAGIVTAAGGGSLLVVGWAGRYVAAFIGGVIGAIALAALLVSAAVSRDPSPLSAVAAYLLLFAIACCVALARRGWTVVSRFVADNAGKAISTIVAGGAIVVFVQFLYTGVYLPTAGTPTVNMKATLKPVGRVGDRMALDGTVTVKNSTHNTVNVLASYYVVLTSRTISAEPVPESRPLTPAEKTAAEGALEAEQPVRSFAAVTRPDIAERGTLTSPGWFLEPGEEIQRHFTALVPRQAALATVRASVVLARRRFVVTIPASPAVEQVDRRRMVVQVSQIDDASWIHEITRSDRYIHSVSPFGTAPLPDCDPGTLLATWIDGEPTTDYIAPCSAARAALSRRFGEHYGLTSSETSTQIAVAPEKAG